MTVNNRLTTILQEITFRNFTFNSFEFPHIPRII